MSRTIAFVLGLAAWQLLLVACTGPTEPPPPMRLPDRTSFVAGGVSAFMERRCGALDCHGQAGRPLRIYSEWGLRLVLGPDGERDPRPTTAEEREQNYRSVVALEPENMARCFDPNDGRDDTFQLLKKPLDTAFGGIRHKGGPVLRPIPADPGWQCLSSWACGKVDKAQCEKAVQIP